MNLLNKKIPSEKYPALIIHIYYLLISVTFCYLYYHKFITDADFYGADSSGGIYAVLKYQAIKPIQYRLLIPFIFKAISIVKIMPDKALFFVLTIGLTYFTLLAFYFLLSSYFLSKAHNCWLSPIIIYPMIWNYIIMNGQFFYMDFSVLLIIVLGFYFIVTRQYNFLLLIFLLGVLNHPSVGYLIIAFLLFNYNKLLKVRTIFYSLAMALIYVGYYSLMDRIFKNTEGYFVIFNLYRNLSMFAELKRHIVARDLLLNFGGLHFFVLIFFLSGQWRKYRGPLLYVNLVIIPYVISVVVSFSIEEIRNYIAVIPFIMILSLIFLSTFENSFLKPVPALKPDGSIKPLLRPALIPGRKLKTLYVTSKGGIHDYRFVKKLSEDYDVLLLHYTSGDLIDEIKQISGIRIISRTPLVKSFPLLTQLGHFKKIYNEFKPDIVHTGYAWQVGILASKLDVHPHLSMVWGSDILTEPDKNFYIKSLVKEVMRQCDHIQCDAEFVKQKIISDYRIEKEKITVFPWGIDRKLFKPSDKLEARRRLNLATDKFIVICDRYLESIYGVMDLLEGFKKFAEGKDNVKNNTKDDLLLLVLSDGSLKNEMIKFIGSSNLDSKVKYIGTVSNSELPLYLNASDIYVSASVSDGTSLSLLEAMSCGLGVVVTDVPAIREWVSEDNGIMVPINSPDRISAALEKYYRQRQLIREHGSINLKIAESRADWDKNYLKLKEVYNRLVNGN